MATAAFSGQVRSLTYDVISKPLHGTKMSQLHNAVILQPGSYRAHGDGTIFPQSSNHSAGVTCVNSLSADCNGVFRALNDPRAPAAVRSLFTPRSAVSVRNTRSTLTGTLQLPNFRLFMSRRAFSFRSASSWNRLSPATRASHYLSSFKALLP